MTDEEVEAVLSTARIALNVASSFYPPIKGIAPFLLYLLQRELRKVQQGVASGELVPDGKGGFVPSTNSRYDPKTGEFL